MGYKTRRTEHAGKLRGSDGQKEVECKSLLKRDSAKHRRRDSQQIITDALAEAHWTASMTRWEGWRMYEDGADG